MYRYHDGTNQAPGQDISEVLMTQAWKETDLKI